MVPEQTNAFVLPVSIVSPTDIARLVREIEGVDNFFRSNSIRQSGESVSLPRLSKLMDQFVANNQLNLLQETDREKVVKILTTLHESAPVLHISFSVDPPGPYVQKIVTWLRKNIHSYVLVTVGLQPNIGAGCVVRTTNKLFDFSLREYFKEKRQFFVDKLHEAIADPEGVMPTPSSADLNNQPTPVQQQPVTAQSTKQSTDVVKNAQNQARSTEVSPQPIAQTNHNEVKQ